MGPSANSIKKKKNSDHPNCIFFIVVTRLLFEILNPIFWKNILLILPNIRIRIYTTLIPTILIYQMITKIE